MARPKQNPTLNFVVGLYKEMKPGDRRTLMLELMALTFDIEFPQTMPARQRKTHPRKDSSLKTIEFTQEEVNAASASALYNPLPGSKP